MSAARLPISREVENHEFVYRVNGKKLRGVKEVERIERIAIPPAWSDVRVAGAKSRKVLARGVDAAGRVQTLYHPAFRRKQERRKFERMLRFAAALPRLRAGIDRDLRGRRLTRVRVTAAVVHLIDLQLFRVGSEAYAKKHRSFGVTTLRRDHVHVKSHTAEFDFVGKSGVRHRRRVTDERLVRVLARLRDETQGPDLFSFVDEEGNEHALSSRHVNRYVKRRMGAEFTAKDFRTWGGTVIAAAALLRVDPNELTTERAKSAAAREAVQEAAERLGNTAAVTRSSYIAPEVLRAAQQPEVLDRVRRARARMRARRFFDVGEQSTVALLAEMTRRSARRR